MDTILEAHHINKTFNRPTKNQVLYDVSFKIERGDYVSLIGKSGSGKSTLLYILSTMDTQYDGTLLIDQESMVDRSQTFLAHIRNKKIGFVFQFHYLLDEFTVLKNVMLPALKLGTYSASEIRERAMNKLEILGIKHLAQNNAKMISGGEKQRVAIARALINDPDIMMCDEPTGNLDKKNSENVYAIFKRLTQEFNQTLLMVTHDVEYAEKCPRVIELEDGRIIRS